MSVDLKNATVLSSVLTCNFTVGVVPIPTLPWNILLQHEHAAVIPPLALILPATVNFSAGVVVPIPTSPPAFI